MDTTLQRFASRLHNLRMERNLTQQALASRAGLHPGYVCSLERGRQVPSLLTMEQLAKGLRMDLVTLVDFPDTSGRKTDRVRDEIALITRRLEKCDLADVRRIRKSIEALTTA